MVKHLVGLGLSRIAIFHQNGAYASREFWTRSARRAAVKSNYSSFEVYLVARVPVDGLRRMRSYDRAALVAGLESLGSGTVSGMSVAYASTNNVASRFVEISILTDDGKVRL